MVETALSPPATAPVPRLALTKLAGVVTVMTVLVVLYGALVRITGSGAGCGQHWPTCNGEVAHLPRRLETWIELGHRATSGLDLLGVLLLAVLAWQRLPPRHPARVAALLALALILVEVAIGAQLVLLNLVGSNMSFDRAVVMPAHLITTSLLVGSLAAATYFSGVRVAPGTLTEPARRQLRSALAWVVLAGGLLLLVSMSGAVTALGDTVYPVQGATTLEHLQNDQAASAHFLGKVRVIHPLLALLGVGCLWIAGSRARAAASVAVIQRAAALLYAGGALALLVGGLNVMLSAPGYLQLVHLCVACLLWLCTVVLGSMLYDAQRKVESEA